MEKLRKIKLISLIAVIALLFILSLVFDKQIVNAIQSVRNPLFDSVFSGILFIEKGFIFYPLILIITTALLAWKKKKTILPFIISTGIVALISFLLKQAIARPRPFTLTQDSFPSGHATVAFTPLPFLSRLFSRWIPIIWLIFACIIAFARLWFGLHYLSDLIAGAAIGYGIALGIKKIWLKKLK